MTWAKEDGLGGGKEERGKLNYLLIGFSVLTKVNV